MGSLSPSVASHTVSARAVRSPQGLAHPQGFSGLSSDASCRLRRERISSLHARRVLS